MRSEHNVINQHLLCQSPMRGQCEIPSSLHEVRFSWHGGEPTVLGLDYFRSIVALQQKHRLPGQTITS